MVSLAPTAMDNFAEAATNLIEETAPGLGNVGVCVDSACTTGRAAINLISSPNPVSKAFFCASIVCGTAGTITSGASLIGHGFGIPFLGFAGAVSARGLNRLGKYTLTMGNVTSGNVTNVTDLVNVME